jgi:hypothetical protein
VDGGKRYRPDSSFSVRSDREGVGLAAEMLSASEAGRMAGVSGQYMTQMARSGRMWALRTALGWLFEESAVRAFARDRAAMLEAKTEKLRGGPGPREERGSGRRR